MPAVSAAVVTFLKWVGVDMAGDVIWKGVKEASKAMVDAFSKETGTTLGSKGIEAIIDAIPRFLPATEDDEIMIREALKLIPDPDIHTAWYDRLNSFDDPVNPKRGRQLKEYVRRYAAGDSPQSTADNIVHQAGMGDKLWDKFKQAMDIQFKADEQVLAPFKAWAATKGANFWTALSARRGELDAKFADTATDIRSFRQRFRAKHGLPPL